MNGVKGIGFISRLEALQRFEKAELRYSLDLANWTASLNGFGSGLHSN
jgi:hypothetical protein